MTLEESLPFAEVPISESLEAFVLMFPIFRSIRYYMILIRFCVRLTLLGRRALGCINEGDTDVLLRELDKSRDNKVDIEELISHIFRRHFGVYIIQKDIVHWLGS